MLNIHTTNFQTPITENLSILTDVVFTHNSLPNGIRPKFNWFKMYPKEAATSKNYLIKCLQGGRRRPLQEPPERPLAAGLGSIGLILLSDEMPIIADTISSIHCFELNYLRPSDGITCRYWAVIFVIGFRMLDPIFAFRSCSEGGYLCTFRVSDSLFCSYSDAEGAKAVIDSMR